MPKFKQFALKRPLLFAYSLLVIYALLGTLTYPIAYLFPDTETGHNFAQAIGKIIIFGCWLLLLWKFGWFKDSGITRVGSPQMWLVAGIIGTYKAITAIFAFSGSWSIVLPTDALKISYVALSLGTGLLEEIMVRGLILMAMILAWGSTRRGVIKSVIVSSFVFGSLHLFNLIIRAPIVVILQAIVVMLPGLFYAVLVLKFRSLWGAILIHGLNNAFLNMKLSTMANFSETNLTWAIYALTLMPIVAFSIYELLKLKAPRTYRDIQDPKPVTSSQRVATVEQPG